MVGGSGLFSHVRDVLICQRVRPEAISFRCFKRSGLLTRLFIEEQKNKNVGCVQKCVLWFVARNGSLGCTKYLAPLQLNVKLHCSLNSLNAQTTAVRPMTGTQCTCLH